MRLIHLLSASALLFLVGCFKASAPPVVADSSAPAVTAEEATPRTTMNKTTQVVLDLDAALAEGGVLADTEVQIADPLTQSAAAYRTSVAKLGGMAVHQAIQLRNAQSIQDPKPLSHSQFMSEIIKQGQPDGIQLAMLPYYQEYAWDVKAQKLVVVDFPARQAQRRQELDNN